MTDIQQTITAHGARAVNLAASHQSADGEGLEAPGLSAATFVAEWTIQTKAWERLRTGQLEQGDDD